ncbi:ABC transporter substrate-binding protein [Filifactor villosus]|uniref:ABC transporter substrate-binding protein n=1 Tax=Filifactor villosus TaxID=29374 RepID=A0ABV9QI32_9FIRM
MKTIIATTKNKYCLLLFLCIFLSLFLLNGCDRKSEVKEEKILKTVEVNKEEDTLFLTMVKTKDINPLTVQEVSVDYTLKLLYEGLYGLDENYNLVPKLADSAVFSNANRILKIKLKSNAKWHSGRNVTSEDVKYTVEYLKAHPESPYHYMVQNISKVSVLDTNSCTVYLVNSDPLAQYDLLFPIVKKGAGANDPFQLDGTGKYRFDGYEAVDMIRLSANKDHYAQVPKIPNIKVRLVRDEQIRSNLFLATDSDVIETTREEVVLYDYDVFESRPYPNLQYEMLIFNSSRPPFKKMKNRRALINALDKELISKEGYRVDKKYNGVFISQRSVLREEILLPKDTGAFHKEWEPDKVKNYQLVVDSSNPIRFASANLIRKELKKSGIHIDVVGVSAQDAKKKLKEGNYDLALIGYKMPLKPNIMKIFNKGNIFFYDPLPLAKKFSSLLVEEDEQVFIQKYKEFQKSFVDEGFYCGFTTLDNYIVKNRRIYGEMKPNVYDIYNGIENLEIKNRFEVPMGEYDIEKDEQEGIQEHRND